MRWGYGFFGVKDIFTIINLLGGVVGIYFAAMGNAVAAGYAVLAGYFFGDVLDGPVARATHTGNRFGSEFDSAADHIGQGIAPAVIVFAAYRADGHTWMGLVLMAALITTASIRQARFNVAKFDFPLAYCGLPRTVSGFIALSFPNTAMFRDSPYGHEVGIVVVVVMAALNLVPIPYMTHRGHRKMQLWVKALVASFLVLPLVLFIFARQYTFDIIFICSFGYAAGAWVPIHPEERKAFYAEYRRWAHEVATLT
jgi:CDP-diacylglycerol--serine O-phosphatidyltransferase